MYLPVVAARFAVALAALSGTTAAMGMNVLGRDSTLAAELGIGPAELLGNYRSVLEIALQATSQNLTVQYATLPIDHEDDSIGTYQNRYWVNDEYYREGGPVFLYDAGESNADWAAKTLANSTSFIAELLREFGGLGITWEHRYYGESLPYPVNVDTPPEHFKYLTTKQALADIPYFAQTFTLADHDEVDLTPANTPWVMVGGSYAGIRAAVLRDQYPETIYASWASSAPVEARVNMSMYFDQVYAGMVANGHLNCTKDIKAALEYIDGELSKNATSAAAIKRLFFGEGAETNSNGDFTAALAGVYDFFQAYGVGGGEGSLEDLCSHLETDPETLQVAGPQGFAPYRGSAYLAQRFASWPIFTTLVNVNYHTNCRQQDDSQPLSCVLNPKYTDLNWISWLWQVCSEWGFYQSNNFGPHSLLSKYQTLAYQQGLCTRQFPEAVKRGILPEWPPAEKMNEETGGWYMRPSNVYWSGGQFDPWRTLSVLATGDIAPQGVTFTTEIPRCNVGTGQDSVFGYIMPNAEHCFDMNMGFAPGQVSRDYFRKALKEWLPCFKGSKHNSTDRARSGVIRGRTWKG